jgi:DNA-binding LytR/AlgR family response regulator
MLPNISKFPMENLVKILVVEDEMIIAAKIAMQLTNLGYEVTGILPRGEEAISQLEDNRPDIILLDINLKGKIDGIETAKKIHLVADIPIIYLTANTDEATFNRAKPTRPYAFISKPFKQLDLQRAIELTISRLAENETGPIVDDNANENLPFILSDRIFVRHHEKMVKIIISDILYIEADRNYCRIFSKTKEYILAITLKSIEDKLPQQHFLRIHRSYIINLSQVDELDDSHAIISGKAIPLGKGMREQIMQRIQTL